MIGMTVCRSICPQAYISETTRLVHRMQRTAVARFFFGGVAICYALPVLGMMSCLHILARYRLRKRA